MVEGRQGDIFEAWRMGSYDVIVLFGHKGVNALSTVLEFDRPFQPTVGELHLPERPGDSFDARPIELKEGGWFVGCADYEEPKPPHSGLSDEKLRNYLQQVYVFCRSNNLRNIICNGVQPFETDEAAWNHRARLSYEIARQNNSVISTTFIDRTDVFVRNRPGYATVLTDRFDRALLYATHVHGGQVRKGTSTPYVAHLLAVAATVLEYGGDEDLAIAALLHDSAEDQGGTARLEDVRNRFGERVAGIVEACSDSLADTGRGERKAHWQERKEAYLARLQKAHEDILRVSLADKVHNARAILRDLRKPDVSEKVWARFGQPKEQTLWYYRSAPTCFARCCPGNNCVMSCTRS